MGRFLCPEFQAYQLPQACEASESSSACAPCQRATQFESTISEIRGLIFDLLDEHRKVGTEIIHVHNPSVLQVPSEITSAIFKFRVPSLEPYCIRRDTEEWKMNFMAPLRLSSVCHAWRSRALSTPQLWTYVPARLNIPSEAEISCIHEYLARSGGLPPFIEVYTVNVSTYNPDTFSVADPIIKSPESTI
ncbi:hypothetical protein CPB84DRAFT_1374366 [Gymnopilus junonius]|uniref:F-box domain-containing protein n=1 Tax=Gymnopilus junonius TaxID=109634 RepID=A0A9P5NK38_GYMJU|nr:hypothetical protein CPB84DRAFT_1374366 [Gymnopilus junonius]